MSAYKDEELSDLEENVKYFQRALVDANRITYPTLNISTLFDRYKFITQLNVKDILPVLNKKIKQYWDVNYELEREERETGVFTLTPEAEDNIDESDRLEKDIIDYINLCATLIYDKMPKNLYIRGTKFGIIEYTKGKPYTVRNIDSDEIPGEVTLTDFDVVYYSKMPVGGTKVSLVYPVLKVCNFLDQDVMFCNPNRASLKKGELLCGYEKSATSLEDYNLKAKIKYFGNG